MTINHSELCTHIVIKHSHSNSFITIIYTLHKQGAAENFATVANLNLKYTEIDAEM